MDVFHWAIEIHIFLKVLVLWRLSCVLFWALSRRRFLLRKWWAPDHSARMNWRAIPLPTQCALIFCTGIMCILSYLFSLWLYSIESRWCTLERIGYSMWNAGTWKGDCRPEQTRVFGYWENYTGWLIFWIRNILWRSCVIVANWNIPERFALKIWNWSDGTRWSREFAWRNIEVRHNIRSQAASGWDLYDLMVCWTLNDRWNGHGGAMSSLHREVKLKLYTDEQFKMSENIWCAQWLMGRPYL